MVQFDIKYIDNKPGIAVSDLRKIANIPDTVLLDIANKLKIKICDNVFLKQDAIDTATWFLTRMQADDPNYDNLYAAICDLAKFFDENTSRKGK